MRDVDEIIRAVEDASDLPRGAVLDRARYDAAAIRARHVVCYVARRLLFVPHRRLGQDIGRSDDKWSLTAFATISNALARGDIAVVSLLDDVAPGLRQRPMQRGEGYDEKGRRARA